MIASEEDFIVRTTTVKAKHLNNASIVHMLLVFLTNGFLNTSMPM